MSLQVTGKAQVYKMEDKGKFAAGTLRTSKKNQQTQEWESEFFNAKFVGTAGAAAKSLADKTKIELTKAILENREYQGKHYISIVVFEFVVEEVDERMNIKAGNEDICPECGKHLNECNCLPF